MPKERYFLSGDRLKVVSFHVLLLDTAGNNLVNADFSLYLGHIFTVKHIYLILYIAYVRRIAPIYSVPLYLARSARRGRRTSGPIASSRSPRSPARARARACVWPRFRPSASMLTSSSRSPPYPFPAPIMAHFIRLYCSFSRRALARCSTLSARRKLFRDRFQAVDIYPAVVRRDG